MDDDPSDHRLQSDWYSPTRLHDSPVKYDFPGDRFIPNRSLMDLDQAHGELTNRTTKGPCKTKFKIEYRKRLNNLTLSAEGRPFQMMVFRGSPKSSRKVSSLIDEMRRSDEEILHTSRPLRRFPNRESRVLDAPDIKDDYYLNIMDWGKTNILAVALGAKVYLWNADNINIDLLTEVRENVYPASVSWSADAKTVATGYSCSRIQLFDAETLKPVRWLYGHHTRVVSTAWNGHLLTSGSSSEIINHDVRARNSIVCKMKVHKGDVCGLKWSSSGNILASGGNDNLIYLWDVCKMSPKHHVYRFNHHRAAVKALAWCPYDYNVLASGGGTIDGSIKIWNTQKGTCMSSTNTKAQISGLQWNRHHKEILSGHGYGYGFEYQNGLECQNRLCLWRYPSMSKIGASVDLRSRVLHLNQSPDGVTVVSAGEDATLRFWEVFGPVSDDSSRMSHLESLLSLKVSPIR